MPVPARKPRVGGNGKKEPHYLVGGPLNGQIAYLHTPGTLEFTLRGEKGYYDHSNQWVSTLKS